VVAAEVEGLRWLIWNGKAKNARRSIDRIRKILHHSKGEHGHRTTGVPRRKLWAALHDVDGYLNRHSNWLVNYAKQYRAGCASGLRATEGTANFLVNRRMNKSQQMRWLRTAADSSAPGSLCGLQRRIRIRVRAVETAAAAKA
jgi:hypothetical protein